ncbi:hypothetical protein LOTGIDRAFT_110590 [Lottia gigantea]|uniref:Uncharacterized protein n=1 Tax=Lottia gigantea TaxID=225164 RepID=V4CKT7_LOTGI|nr:hypothetical protein LOTGIDRAFT_110590 [Lottia gigantea]ESP02845.1 hypothetical protein LOTGIDRAFT_110590 [Lottia gigantea]
MQTYLHVLDSYFSVILFGPLVTAYWRGTWEIADVYLFPDNSNLSFGVSTAAGVLVYLCFNFSQDHFTSLNYKMSSPMFCISSRLHAYILGHAMVNYWRGIMGFMDKINKTYLYMGLETILSTILLAVLKGSINAISAPLLTIPDTGPHGRKDYFQISTKLKTKSTESWSFFLDCCYSVLIISGLVIVQWHGVWGLIDLMIVPQDQFKSAWLSLVIGYAMTMVLLIVQWPVMAFAKKARNETFKCYSIILLLIEIFMSFCGTTASAFVWRGFWNLQDQLLLPNNLELSVWISHGIGTICLMIMFHFNTAIQAGLDSDGDIIFSDEQTFFDIKFICNIIRYSGNMVCYST